MATRKRTQAAVPDRRGQSLVLGGALLLGTGLGAGFFAGQYFPRQLDPAPTMTEAVPPEVSAGVDTPIPSEVYSFYRMFDDNGAPGPQAAVAEPDVAPMAVAQDGSGVAATAVADGVSPTGDSPASGLEEGAAMVAEEGDLAGLVEPTPTSTPTIVAVAPDRAEPEETRSVTQALTQEQTERSAPEPAAAATETATLASALDVQGGTESRVVRRTVQRSRTEPAEAGAPPAPASTDAPVGVSSVTTRVVRDGQSQSAAESQAASLRSVGLTASTTEAGDGTWQVVIRVNGNESEVRRQTSLAARRLASQ